VVLLSIWPKFNLAAIFYACALGWVSLALHFSWSSLHFAVTRYEEFIIFLQFSLLMLIILSVFVNQLSYYVLSSASDFLSKLSVCVSSVIYGQWALQPWKWQKANHVSWDNNNNSNHDDDNNKSHAFKVPYSGAAVAQWLRRCTCTQQTWVQLPLVPVWVIGGSGKGIGPKLLPCANKSPTFGGTSEPLSREWTTLKSNVKCHTRCYRFCQPFIC